MVKMRNGLVTTCLICDSSDYEAIASYNEPDQYERTVGIGPGGYFRMWVRCTSCCFIYSIYSRDHRILDNIYTEVYRGENVSWRKKTNEDIFREVTELPESESETKFRVKWIKRTISDVRTNGKTVERTPMTPYAMLDIGGGTGIFAYEFQDEEWISHVIDADHSGQFIEDRLGIPFIAKKYEPLSFDCKFDLITLIFVLEHLEKPLEVLRQLHEDMSLGSFLYIEVPDAICFDLKPPGDDIFNSCHLWMFTPKTLTTLLNVAGYEISVLERVQTIRGHYAITALARW
jgi:SAM-dependent methyltransferase